MPETTRNFYRENCYPREVISDFTRKRQNLSQSPRLSDYAVSRDPFFSGLVNGPIDLLYRFHDSYSEEHQQYPPALGFRFLTDSEMPAGVAAFGDFALVYIDPSIESLWKEAMDKDVEYE